MSRLDPGHPRLAVNTPNPERVSVPWASLSPIALVHLLMAPPLLLPYTAWHMMRTKADAMGITQWVTPLMEWLRAASVDPQQGISVVEAGDKKIHVLPPPPPLHGHQARVCPSSNRSRCRQPHPYCLHQLSKQCRSYRGGERTYGASSGFETSAGRNSCRTS